MGKRKTIDENYIYELWNAGFNAKEIAKQANCSIAKAYKIRYDKIGHICPREKNDIRKKVIVLYKNGNSQSEIGRQLGVSRQRVNQIVKEEMSDFNDAVQSKKKNLIDNRKEMAVTEYLNGALVSDIMEKYQLRGEVLYKYLDEAGIETRRKQGFVPQNAIYIKVYDLGGNFVGEYKSIRSACAELGIEDGFGNVAKYLKNGKKVIYGYEWETNDNN